MMNIASQKITAEILCGVMVIFVTAGCVQQSDQVEETRLCEQHPEVYHAMKEYPWVEWAARKGTMPEIGYIEDICYLADISPSIAYRIMYSQWITDYISEKEAAFLETVVSIADYDLLVAEEVMSCWWLVDSLQDKEVEAIQTVYEILLKSRLLAQTAVSSSWFKTYISVKELNTLHLMNELPLDYAEEIAQYPWFSDYLTYEEVQLIEQGGLFYNNYPEFALAVLDLESFSLVKQENVLQIKNVNHLIGEDKVLFEMLKSEPLTPQSWRVWSSLSVIAAEDGEFALTIHGRLHNIQEEKAYAVENLMMLFQSDSLFTSYLESQGYLKEFNEEKSLFLRFLAVLTKYQEVEDYQAAVDAAIFAASGLVYEDRYEPYRYHLLWQTLQVMEPEQLSSQKMLLKVSLEIYAERFYKWNVYDTELLELSNDEFLNDLEYESYLYLLAFFLEDEHLVVDLNQMTEADLFYLVNVPYQYVVNLDGTITPVENLSSSLMRGSAAVMATVHNILTLEARREILMRDWGNAVLRDQHLQHRGWPLLKLIIKEGELRDQLFVFVSGKHWQAPTEEACICQTYQSMMDLKSVGIPTTHMYWYSGDTAHVYPAYLSSEKILQEVKEDSGHYDHPFVYHNFISPWDEAGYKDLKPRKILVVQAYDAESGEQVTLWGRPEGVLERPRDLAVLLALTGGIIFVLIKVMQHFFSMRLT